MKKSLLFFAFIMFFLTGIYSQASFNTGALGVDINEYGKIELINADGIYQSWRNSILVGASESAVFDYQNDAETNEPTILVENPLLSDFEIYGAYDNTYSELPPNVIVKLNAYGWTNGGYIIVKFNIINNETTSLSAVAGLDIIPYIDETDGFDSVSYLSDEAVIRIHRGAETNTGIKLLSSSLTSLYSFEYYDDYYVDSDYWNWMKYGSLQPLYASNSANGSVSITAQAPVGLEQGGSFDVFYAFALGADEETMLANIAAAQAKYDALFTSVDEAAIAPVNFNLGQNYPNPFSNSTKISYQLPGDGQVSLKIYNTLGMEIATLVNTEQSRGSYTVDFSAENLTNGVYFCTLRFDNEVMTHKMFLVK